MNFLISILATWRISSMLVKESGPFDVFDRLRDIAGVKYNQHGESYGTNMWSSLLSCVWCTSVWVGFLVALLEKPKNIGEYFRRALALSACAIFVDEVLHRKEN